MSDKQKIDLEKCRKYIASLYTAVLTEKITVREALANFPKDTEDETAYAAWHALCHLEADEDLRKKDKMYAQEQDEYIEYIAFTLSKGGALPENIINSYKPYHEDVLTAHSHTFKGIVHLLKKFLCC